MSKNTAEEAPRPPYRTTSQVSERVAKNLILYGPPGTGKTHYTVNYALAIIEGKPLEEINQEPRQKLLQRFNHYRAQQQVESITFHPSYAYEDFVQGLRPNTHVGTLLFEKRDGIFKRLADRARKNFERFYQRQMKPRIPFEDLLNLLLSNEINPDTEDIEIPLDIHHRIYKSIIIYDISEDALIYRRRTKNDIVKDEAKKLSTSKLAELYSGKDIKEAINLKYYQAVIEAVKNYEASWHTEDEDLELKNYVLIIDEINRANISRVFGELITLIEENKRFGASQATTLRLPSGEEFSVPTNLYLLGTMNTADKSIALLDIALRRRFKFQAFYPDESLIAEPKVQEVLRKLNQAIWQEKKSADFLIGHAFFLNKPVEDLAEVFDQQIIPLLEEYFLYRLDKVKQILKASGIESRMDNYQLKFGNLVE